ncbi:MAG: transporter substrate binding protein [Firmicutes bacterium]|nr:transporter substrate binding protein [Bacillota bacterium]
MHLFHIGILQLTQNLDDAVRGFKQGLKELAVEADFHYFNADGNINELPKLAQKLADINVDLIFACSTPAAKAAANLSKNIPVLFTPVFDPISVNLVDSLAAPSGKLTGMSGMVNAKDKVNFIHELLPNAKKLGMLYHTEDSNSLIEASNFRKALTGKFELNEITITRKEDISLLAETFPQGLDALFLPIGRVVEENFASIAYYTDAINVPIITSHAPNVVLGSLGALVANHATLGKACAAQAKQILVDGKEIKNIPVGMTETPEVLLNAFVADNLGIEIPNNLLTKATEVYE